MSINTSTYSDADFGGAKSAIKSLLNSSYIGVCLTLLLKNQLTKVNLAVGDIQTNLGMRHAELDLQASIAYVKQVHREYLQVAGIDGFYGRIAEVGPGDNCGAALLMLADGAEHVDLVDRFYSRRDLDRQSAIYRQMISTIPALAHLEGRDREEEFDGITRRYGEEASAEKFFVTHEDYDFIVSCAVLEHISDPALSLARMKAALKPGGVMMHAVDLRDHAMFSGHGFSELKFLESPDWLYREMAIATGLPNRVRLASYREALPEAEFKVASLFGVGSVGGLMDYEDIPAEMRERSLETVRAAKSRMHPQFRAQSDEDLSVSSFFMCYRKPGLGGSA